MVEPKPLYIVRDFDVEPGVRAEDIPLETGTLQHVFCSRIAAGAPVQITLALFDDTTAPTFSAALATGAIHRNVGVFWDGAISIDRTKRPLNLRVIVVNETGAVAPCRAHAIIQP